MTEKNPYKITTTGEVAPSMFRTCDDSDSPASDYFAS